MYLSRMLVVMCLDLEWMGSRTLQLAMSGNSGALEGFGARQKKNSVRFYRWATGISQKPLFFRIGLEPLDLERPRKSVIPQGVQLPLSGGK